jgi:protein phosphatase
VDVIKESFQKDDAVVLCSDGVWDVVSRADISEVTAAIGTPAVPTAKDAADQLIATAIERGTTDNVTAVVVRITSDRPIPAAGGRRLFFRRRPAT